MFSQVEVWVDGVPMSSLCRVTDIGWSTRYPYGDWYAEFTVHVPPSWRHSALRPGAEVLIKNGAARTWLGDLSEPDWERGEMTARGRVRAGEGYLGQTEILIPDPLGAWVRVPAFTPGQAIGGAISGTYGRDPLDWVVDAATAADSVWTTSMFAEAQDEWMNMLQWLDLIAARGHGIAMLSPGGKTLRFHERPTVPEWHVHPDVVDIAEAGGEGRANQVIVTYLSTDPEEYRRSAVATDARFGPWVDMEVDARNLGPQASVGGQAIADALLAEQLRPTYTTDITATPLTVTVGNGQPCDPLALRAGMLGRVHGASHPRLPHNYIDVLAGEVEVKGAETSSPTATIRPEHKPARTLAEMFQKAAAS